MKQKKWKIPYGEMDIPAALTDAGYTPLLSAVLSLKGIRQPQEADTLLRGVDTLCDPFLMQDMRAAAERVHLAFERGEKVAVYGDYDVDGITSTCLVTEYMRSRGLQCIPYIPDRNDEGYGLNCGALDYFHTQGVSLVITVDCGITAVNEARYAKELGIDLIITDHHECGGGELPDALAVIDCKREDDHYPNSFLAGVGVALKLVSACEGDSEKIFRRFGDLVAIGTVADVMPLLGENRYMVKNGLEQLIHSPRPGIAAMLRASGIEPYRLNSTSIGYGLAPRLNAAGRLGHASIACRLLMATDTEEACALAGELCELNRKRQAIELEIWQEAKDLLASASPDVPIVLASSEWHQGVIGIAASRLAEQYSLPAIMICLNGDVGKGSCRSYGDFNLFDALSACSEHLIGFGGHALAAGLNIRSDKLADFRQALADYYRKNRPVPLPDVRCDLNLTDASLLTVENVRSLDMLEPYGSGNQRTVMCLCGVHLEAIDGVGREKKHTRLKINVRGQSLDAMFFSHSPAELELRAGEAVDIAFSPQINEYMGHTSVQLLVSAVRPHDGRELCEKILRGDTDIYRAAAPYVPCRPDHAKAWRSLGDGFTVPADPSGVLSMCPPGMEAEKFCICLMSFLQAGLLASPDGQIFGSGPVHLDHKADLESTDIILRLRSY